MIDSLQLTAERKLATPANWKNGEDCIVVPAVSDADAEKCFRRACGKIKPYLRYAAAVRFSFVISIRSERELAADFVLRW